MSGQSNKPTKSIEEPKLSAPKSQVNPFANADTQGTYTKKSAKKAMLDLIVSLTKNKGRQGKIAAARAAIELAQGNILGDEKSGVDWNYWLAKWGSQTGRERRRTVQHEIVPVLLSQPATPAPSSRQAKPKRSPPFSHSNQNGQQPSKENLRQSFKYFEEEGWNKERIDALAKLGGVEDWG